MVISHLLAAVLLVAVPLWDVWETRRLRRSGARVRSYVAIIVALWALTSVALLEHPLDRLFAAPDTGVPPLSDGAAVAITLALLAGLVAPVGVAAVHRPTRARLVRAAAALDYLLPRTNAEMALFAGVSVTAGICEELIYRGFLLHYARAEPLGLSTPLALAASSVLFGWLYVASGTLLLPMVLHALVDLRALAAAYLARGARGGVGG